jgi:hypothetical protein
MSMKKLIEVCLVIGGLLALALPLMGCEPRTPAMSASEVQAQQWREINAEQVVLYEQRRKVVCLKVAAGDPFAMVEQLAYKITCKSGE